MSPFKRLSYSFSWAIVISALSSVFYPMGGEIAAVPGILFEGFVNAVIVEITHDMFAGFVNRWIFFSVVFYTVVIYCVSLAVYAIKNERMAKSEALSTK